MKRRLLELVAFVPITVAFLLVQFAEPFPRRWLSPHNPHIWANLLRALSFLLAGMVLGMIAYTLIRSIEAERTVSGGHPRKKLYRHVTLISCAHGLLVASLLFYIREKIDTALSPATPVVLVGLVGTFVALKLMLSYQNSRLQRFHSAKQVLGVIEPADEETHDLCIRVVGATEPIRLRDWVGEFEGGVLSRLTIEKVEEHPEPEERRRYLRWLARGDRAT